jgi:moderate conductance mechanosensitive channel
MPLDVTWSQMVLGPVGRTVFIVVLAVLTRVFVHRIVTRGAERIARGRAGLIPWDERDAGTGEAADGDSEAAKNGGTGTGKVPTQRREQRARTMAGVLRTITTVAVVVIATLMVFPQFGLSAGPLLASAGILGVALGFGAQTLVKDLLSGMFIIAEDQFGVGDVVDLGRASGTVEAVGLRVTRLRDPDGTIWYVRNGEVLRVGNHSQSWSRTFLDIGVPAREDLDRVQEVLREVGAQLGQDPTIAPLIVEDLVWEGIESLSEQEVVLRVTIKTQPLRHREVAQALRARIRELFDAAGIRVLHVGAATRQRTNDIESGSDDEEFEPVEE